MTGKVFLNYRRADAEAWADHLFERLVRQFPRENVFMDIDGDIPVGFPWADWLDSQVAACDLMLVLIGRSWVAEFKARSEAGDRDYVRVEIESALKRKIPVVPVFLGDTPVPKSTELPDTMRPLLGLQAARLQRMSFDSDAETLAKGVARSIALARGEAVAWDGVADLRDPLRPRIDLSCKVRPQEQLPKGSPLTKWVLLVVNPLGNTDLIDCEVQVVSLYRNGERLYDEPLNCIWSNSQDIRRTIRPGIPQSASLCMADAGKPGLYLTTSVNKPQILRAMRKPESAIYRVDVAVYAANSKPIREWFVVEYGGDFAHIEIRPENVKTLT